MIEVLIAPALIVALVLGLFVWRAARDRAEERALAVRAEVQSAVNRALEGESLLAVQSSPRQPSTRAGSCSARRPAMSGWCTRRGTR